MSDLPLILSISANVGIAGIGFLGVRQQNKTAQHGIDAQASRERAGRAEEHLQHRQSVYHDYLNAVRALGPLMALPQTKQAEFLQWRNRYEYCLNAVELFGSEQVQRAAAAYHELVSRIGVDKDGHELPTHADISAHYWSLQSELRDGFRAVLTAMRTDIAEDQAALH